MPQPRKYQTDAERSRAYRERKSARDTAMRRELERLKPAAARSTKRKATTGDDLRPKLRDLLKEITKRRKKAKARLQLVELLDYIQSSLVHLAARQGLRNG